MLFCVPRLKPASRSQQFRWARKDRLPPQPTPPKAASQLQPRLRPTRQVQPRALQLLQVGDTLLFQIVPEQSAVRFIINEVLSGSPKTVIGETNQVAGQIEVNLGDPSASRVGIIQVNARALTTDNEFRNRAIKNQILQSDTYEFVTFTPTSLSGMPASVAVGDTFTFQVTGDLTIRDVTKSIAFDVEVTAVSETSLTGKAVRPVFNVPITSWSFQMFPMWPGWKKP